ncbi:hypothetical protein TD95_005347 [Thielaviopsis punctulata]|uniref:tRNA wybutosine-synthesizing protein 2 n=1 Tax=Thielaviopsis punctulata TaxID=72032 RepID=A0A0F4ZDC1_9PEZI|nr:hypothetical protein TD95_005347 [Thielaviopsis punctulata]
MPPQATPGKTRRGIRDWRQCTTSRFLSLFPPDQLLAWSSALALASPDQLTLNLPKGYLTYEPLAIFPSNSLPDGPGTLLSLLQGDQREILWRIVLEELARKSGMRLTHLAVNAGIPLQTEDAGSSENIMRRPTGLREVFGDFGAMEGGVQCAFAEALWVWTRQNGIWQTWAPKWTMFSRGNVVEKARLLDFHSSSPSPPNPSSSSTLSMRHIPATDLRHAVAVDMYAGIGYFVFSYARLGMRVFGWELNPWSVEGLRRGALKNGWSVQVVQAHDTEIGDAQIVVFLEDNRNALRRLARLQEQGKMEAGRVLHVNGGLLPSSEASWRDSWTVTRECEKAWLHLHDNVGVDDIEKRAVEIEAIFNKWAEEEGGQRRAKVEFTMKVKTFAPGVWHCVYDVYVYKI